MNNSVPSKSLFLQIHEELSTLYSKEEAQAITYLLLEAFFGLKRFDLISNKNIIFGIEEKRTLNNLIERLKKAEPIQYLIGETEFYGLRIKVNPDVLIPRRETEELVDLIIKENKDIKDLKVLDLCTGSGCIAIALQKNLNQSSTFALDISDDALNVASLNAQLNKVIVHFQKSDVLRYDFPENSFNIIVSNPPYIEKSEKYLMHRNVLDYEPSIALFVENEDPLIFYKRIVQMSKSSLVIDGRIYFEINERFGEQVKRLLISNGFDEVQIIKDLQGKDRIAKAVFADPDKLSS